MTDANPKCEHCRKPLVFIGIGPGAEAIRTCKCEDGPECPQCQSRRTELFVMLWSDEVHYHCIPFGHVFTLEEP